jgi:hypothetical protein
MYYATYVLSGDGEKGGAASKESSDATGHSPPKQSLISEVLRTHNSIFEDGSSKGGV